MDERTRIPVVGQVGQAAVERTFCPLAHDFLRGELGPIEFCGFRVGESCGMAGGLMPCLFDVPDDPQWLIIQRSVELERTLPTAYHEAPADATKGAESGGNRGGRDGLAARN